MFTFKTPSLLCLASYTSCFIAFIEALPQYYKKKRVNKNVRQIDFDIGNSKRNLTYYSNIKYYLITNLKPFSSIYTKRLELSHLIRPNKEQNKKNGLSKLQM